MKNSTNKPNDKKIRVLLHDIRSLWNVGSMFRTADSFAIEKVYLTGYTALPPRREIAKTALGADSWVPWEGDLSPESVIEMCRNDGFHIVALEITEGAVPLLEFASDADILLIVGNEVSGVPSELMQLSDDTVSIAMLGKKESLNVSVSAGIALHHLRFC